jgi:hypothetical protein
LNNPPVRCTRLYLAAKRRAQRRLYVSTRRGGSVVISFRNRPAAAPVAPFVASPVHMGSRPVGPEPILMLSGESAHAIRKEGLAILV